MPNLDYVYSPVYGVEPYLDNGGLGGATLTQNNLVVTAWQVTDKFQTPPDYLEFGYILKPSEVNTALPAIDRVAGTQAFDSRHSAYVYLNPDTGDNVSPIITVCLVLNPPPEMKQLLQGAVTYNGGNPLLPASFTVTKSLQAAYVWRNLFNEAKAHNLMATDNDEVNLCMFSSYLFYGEPTNEAVSRIPFLQTNGADGATPLFFDVSIASGVNAMIEAVNDGAFYVSYSVFTEVDSDPPPFNGNYCGVAYPHSAARG